MGGSKDQTTTTKADPWSGQQPYLTDLFSQAQQLYQGGPQQYFPGQTVAPFSPHTQQAFDMMTQTALGPNPQFQAFGNYLGSQLSQPNLDPNAIYGPAAQAAGGIGPGMGMMAGAGADPLAGGVLNMAGGLGEAQPLSGSLPAISAGQMGTTAAGGYLGSNPYLDAMYGTAAGRAGEAFQEQTMPAIAAQFGGAGRTGGGIHQEMAGNAARQFGRDLQGMAADIYAPAYEAERGRQLQAAQMGGQYDLGSRGLGFQAGQGLGDLGMRGVGQMGDLYGNIAQNQFRAGTLMPQWQDMRYGDAGRMLGMGQMMEDQTQRLMGAAQDRWNFGQSAPWQNLGNYANLIYGLPGNYGTTKSTQPGGSRLGGMIGGGLAGWGATGNPWGAVIGGLGGLL